MSVEHANSELKQGLELSKKLQQGILKYALMPCPHQVVSPCVDSILHKRFYSICNSCIEVVCVCVCVDTCTCRGSIVAPEPSTSSPPPNHHPPNKIYFAFLFFL